MTYTKADTYNIKVNLNKCIKCTEWKWCLCLTSSSDKLCTLHSFSRYTTVRTYLEWSNSSWSAPIKSVSNETEFKRKCPWSNRYQTRMNLKKSVLDQIGIKRDRIWKKVQVLNSIKNWIFLVFWSEKFWLRIFW